MINLESERFPGATAQRIARDGGDERINVPPEPGGWAQFTIPGDPDPTVIDFSAAVEQAAKGLIMVRLDTREEVGPAHLQELRTELARAIKGATAKDVEGTAKLRQIADRARVTSLREWIEITERRLVRLRTELAQLTGGAPG